MFLEKNYVVIVMRETAGHVCAMQNLPVFEGIVFCQVVEEEEYELLSEKFETKFGLGQLMYFEENSEKKEVTGQQIQSVRY